VSFAGFLDIDRLRVRRSMTETTQEHLRHAGSLGAEGMVLWAGRAREQAYEVEEVLIPKQYGVRTEDGVCVVVDGDELFRINVHLHDEGRTMIAQIHSHPGDAYHSETDDAYPIVTTVGALSLVVPDFGRGPFDLARCATYRLLPDRGWVLLSPAQAEALIRIEE